MRKFMIFLACLAGYGFICSVGPVLPAGVGGWAIAECGLMLLIPIGLFVGLVRSFHSWHKTLHRAIILEAMKHRRSS